MAIKQAEVECRNMLSELHVWIHKWADVRMCPNCHKPIFQSREDVSGETIVDFLAFFGNVPAWIECKGMPGHNTLPFSEITEKQRNFLTSWTDRGVLAFLFVTLGTGRVPKDRQAWLIPWKIYLETEKSYSLRKSWPWRPTGDFKGFNQLFWDCELLWDAGGWHIPGSSLVVAMIPNIFNLPSLYEVKNG